MAPNVKELTEICNEIDKHDAELKKIKGPEDEIKPEKCFHKCGKKINVKEFHTKERAKLVEQYKKILGDESLLPLTPV